MSNQTYGFENKKEEYLSDLISLIYTYEYYADDSIIVSLICGNISLELKSYNSAKSYTKRKFSVRIYQSDRFSTSELRHA